jgi:hypothetical protein
VCVERVSAMCTVGMPHSRSVALEGRLVGCLYRAPPRPRGRRPRGLILTALGGGERAERQCGRERRRGMQKPLAACQGKTNPGAVRLVALAKCTRRAATAPGGGKSRKRTAAGGRPRALGNAGGAAGSVHGLSLRVDTLSTLSTLSPMRSVK